MRQIWKFIKIFPGFHDFKCKFSPIFIQKLQSGELEELVGLEQNKQK